MFADESTHISFAFSREVNWTFFAIRIGLFIFRQEGIDDEFVGIGCRQVSVGYVSRFDGDFSELKICPSDKPIQRYVEVICDDECGKDFGCPLIKPATYRAGRHIYGSRKFCRCETSAIEKFLEVRPEDIPIHACV